MSDSSLYVLAMFMLGSLFGFSIANLKSFKRNQDGARRG